MSAKYPTRSELKNAQAQARARDIKSKGGNPVRVSDLRQRNGVGNQPGKPFLTTLLRRGRG
jgi:hypothetical protein